MASRLFARAALPTARRVVVAPRAVARRYMSSGHGSTSSDMPWIIGSSLVFGPMIAWLLVPQKKEHGHGHESHKETPHEPVKMADSEGKEEDVSGSMSQAFDSDSPKDAADAEAEGESSSAPVPHAADDTPAPQSEPDLQTKQKRGTFQKEGESGPTDMGTARAAARQSADEGAGNQNQSPKKAKDEGKPADGKSESGDESKSD